MMWYFATAGRGTEDFLKNEIQEKLIPNRIYKVDGKVFFEASSIIPANQLVHLKSAERLFVSIYYSRKFTLYQRQDLRKFRGIISNIQTWNAGVEAWKDFQQLGAVGVEDGRHVEINHVNAKRFEDESPPTKICKMQRGGMNLTFRVSCKCSGNAARTFSSQDISKEVGYVLAKRLGWQVNLQQPELEVFLQVNNGGIIIGLTLTRKPLSIRPYLKVIGLRSTVAWIMALMADIQPGDKVIDPMCGAATILIEASHSWKNAVYIGSDVDWEALQKAFSNVNNSTMASQITLLRANITALPVKSSSMDVIVCDTPFGINHGQIEDIKTLHSPMLAEMNRVLTPGGRVVLLTSSALKEHLLEAVNVMNGRIMSQRHEDNPSTDTEQSKFNVPQLQHHDDKKTTDDTEAREKQVVTQSNTALQSNQNQDNPEELNRVQITKTDLCGIKTGDTETNISSRKPPPENCAEDFKASAGQSLKTYVKYDNQELSISCKKKVSLYKEHVSCAWTTKTVHYIKLGETHAYVCLFIKENLPSKV